MMALSKKITAFALTICLSTTPCYAVDTTNLLSYASEADGMIEKPDNTLYLLDRNPYRITFSGDYTGVYQLDTNHHLYCLKNGETVQFTPEFLHSWYSEKKEESGLEQATKEFISAYENHSGYNEAFWHTNDVREVFVFEMIISDTLSNSLLSAGQDNLIYIEYDNKNPDSYIVKMGPEEKVEKFRNELNITNQLLQECDALVNATSDPFEKVKQINNFVIDKLYYNSEKINRGNEHYESHSEIEALCYNTGTVCAGYCNLFQLLCERYGIETENVETDPSQGAYHAWSTNFIDGNWYYTDTTWNENWDNYFLLLTKEEMDARHAEAMASGTRG